MSSPETTVHRPSAMSALSRFEGAYFVASSHVTSTWAPDAVMLMDRRSGMYYTLNEVGGRIWTLLCAGEPPAAIVATLAAEYDVPRDRLEIDVAATIDQLLSAHLIGARTEAPQPHSAAPALAAPAPQEFVGREHAARVLRVPSVLESVLVITAIKLALATLGYAGTLERLRRHTGHIPATEWAEMEVVRAAEYNVALAAALYPARAQCLERSLALYWVLRRQGLAARYYQGTQPYPFQAHAWIEYRGEVINDVTEHVEMYARLPEQLP